MSIKILERFARRAGWSRDMQIRVLLEYIERQRNDAGFAEYLRTQAEGQKRDMCNTTPHALEERVDVDGTDNEGGLTVSVWCEACEKRGTAIIPVVDVDWD